MDGMTPGLDCDNSQPSADTVGAIPSSQSSDGGSNHAGGAGAKSASASSAAPKFSGGPHIRSRITVVCAECKRLKLKCDRRTPCSSCLKRDTVQRCVYSQAAAEKIDVQSLHNRLLVVEGTLSQLTSSSSSLSSALGGIPPFKSSYPSSLAHSSSSGALPQLSSTPFNNGSGSIGSTGLTFAGLPCNDRALLAIGASGSSVVINLEDVASFWLSELDLNLNAESSGSQVSPHANGLRLSSSASSKSKVKLEPSPVLLPLTPPSSGYGSSASTPGGTSYSTTSPAFVPPIPYSTFLPLSRHTDVHSPTSASPPNLLPSFPSAPSQHELPQVTPALLQHLPSLPSTRAHLMRVLGDTMSLHPCFNVRHFERRVEAMIAWAELPTADPPDDGRPKQKELARELFLGVPPSRKRKPTLSFFAASTAAFALAALLANDGADSRPSTSSGVSVQHHSHPSPAVLYALSDQALSLFEKTNSYDLDALIAMILQLLYQLHDGQLRIAQGVFPMVAKMVNIARMMGLAIDPEEFPGTFSLFDAEARRRVWWDIYYYDVFISDCMGQSPLIAEGSFTTKLPSDVDESQFTSSSTSLPTPPADGDCGERSSSFFILKCRLAQLVKSIRKHTFKDSPAEEIADLSIEQAAASESDVTVWLAELPQRYHLEGDPDFPTSSAVSPALIPQRCLLAMTAARIVLKLYLPFLRDNHSKPPHQAVLGTISAAHNILGAARLLHSVWKGVRPTALDFYDYGRTVFDAAIVCAHVVIQHPTNILIGEAMKVVNLALEILRELGWSRGEDTPNDAWRIVDMMKRKAELSKANGACMDDVVTGNKRKRTEFEEYTFDNGLQLPFVGASISSARTNHPPKPPTATKDVPTGAHKSPADSPKSPSKEKGERKYPAVGIRVRPGQTRPAIRQRTDSMSPGSTLSIATGHTPSTPVSALAPGLPHPDAVPIQTASNVPAPEPPLTGYSAYHPSPPQLKEAPTQPHGLQHDHYPANDPQRYHQFSGTSPPMPMYDSPAPANSYPSEHMPSVYQTRPAENFFVSYPPTSSSSFDVASMSNQGLSAEYSVQATPASVESPLSAPPTEHSYLLPSDKIPTHPYHRGKPDAPGGHEYSQPPIVVQAWSQPGAPQAMWDYKYYSGVAG